MPVVDRIVDTILQIGPSFSQVPRHAHTPALQPINPCSIRHVTCTWPSAPLSNALTSLLSKSSMSLALAAKYMCLPACRDRIHTLR